MYHIHAGFHIIFLLCIVEKNVLLLRSMAALDAKASTSKENAGARVSPSKTIYSSPSLSTSGFLSDNDLSPPWDQGWQLFIPASIQDGPSRFGFIEVCTTTFSYGHAKI